MKNRIVEIIEGTILVISVVIGISALSGCNNDETSSATSRTPASSLPGTTSAPTSVVTPSAISAIGETSTITAAYPPAPKNGNGIHISAPAETIDVSALTAQIMAQVDAKIAAAAAQVKYTTYRVYAESPYTEATDRMEWAPCKTDSVIVGGGCDCGGSTASQTWAVKDYQIYNAQFCRCNDWRTRMLAYAVCLKGPGISSPDYSVQQNQEGDRLNLAGPAPVNYGPGVQSQGVWNTMDLDGGVLFTPWDYQWH